MAGDSVRWPRHRQCGLTHNQLWLVQRYANTLWFDSHLAKVARYESAWRDSIDSGAWREATIAKGHRYA